MEMDTVDRSVSHGSGQCRMRLTSARIWNVIVFIGLATTYFPKSHPRLEGLSKKQILGRIDYLGAILSITGITLL